MFKKLVCMGITFVMLCSLADLSACVEPKEEEMEIELKQGIYISDDGIAKIELYGDNLFRLSIVYASSLRQGNYTIENNKLILRYFESPELIFDIESDSKIIFLGANIEGLFVDEEPIKIGTVFSMMFVEVEAEEMIELHTWSLTFGVPNNAIRVKHSDESAIFECIVDKGQFGFENNGPKSMIANPGDTLYWQDVNAEVSVIGHAFFETILKVDNNIVGYAVVSINATTYMWYNAMVLKAVLFPKIDGEYQNITENQVNDIIEKIKDK